ncbi:hypothetical protein DSO57_1013964 [Entomophthora muscae]|uniref:Uncharacterized protein n=1 Tax=Entomophthora muscae TaxID=34485 RepID=A0ACC2S7K5_9FUNG|nr:hypothetical protein DSO57_1013964 [Entomophthora muscae]
MDYQSGPSPGQASSFIPPTPPPIPLPYNQDRHRQCLIKCMVHRVVFSFLPYILLFPCKTPNQPAQSPALQLVETVEPVTMDYQSGPSPGQASSFIPPTPPPIPLPSAEVIPYDHSRYGMVILTIISLAEVAVPHLGAYCPLAAGMLYLSCSLPFMYWALVLQYPDGWTPPMLPWYSPIPGHDSRSFKIEELDSFECIKDLSEMGLPDQVEAAAYVITPLADLSSLNDTEREQASTLFEKYRCIFSEDNFDLGCVNEVTYYIDTGDNKPVCLQPI